MTAQLFCGRTCPKVVSFASVFISSLNAPALCDEAKTEERVALRDETREASPKRNTILPLAGYMQVIRRRTLTKWSNVHLETVGESVEDIIDLLHSGVTAKLLSVLSGRRIAVPIFEPQRRKRQYVGWKNVCRFLASQDFPEDVIGRKVHNDIDSGKSNNAEIYLSILQMTLLVIAFSTGMFFIKPFESKQASKISPILRLSLLFVFPFHSVPRDKITNKGRTRINASPNQKNAAFTRG